MTAASPWLDGMPGLAAQARQWQTTLPAVRRSAAAEAAALATPRLWTDTIASFASTGWRIATAAAPDAPLVLISAAASATGLPVAPPDTGRGALDRAQRLVQAGGPAYIKLGQFIASGRGLLPDAWVDAFAWCRDQAPPLRPRVAERVIAAELGPDSRLEAIDPEPIAAGSIGQVHRGVLRDGTEVVVKVRRPRLRRRLRADIETMALAAAAAERLHPAARTANLRGFVELFAALTLEELDFRLEAQNLIECGLVLETQGLDFVRVPRPIPGLVTERVLVMERMEGVSYDRAPAVYGDTLDGDRLVELAIRGVLEATLVHGVFHGDLHAGNVFVQPDGTFGLVDFGICGRLDPDQRAGLVAFLAAFAAGDAAGQIHAMARFGAIPAGADLHALIAELQQEADRLDQRLDGAVTFDRLGETLGRVLRVLSAGGFQLPKELVLFFKNLLYLSGFTAGFAPDADIFRHVERVLGELWEKHPEVIAAAA
jgi:ubiquinone biosynthesis protein